MNTIYFSSLNVYLCTFRFVYLTLFFFFFFFNFKVSQLVVSQSLFSFKANSFHKLEVFLLVSLSRLLACSLALALSIFPSIAPMILISVFLFSYFSHLTLCFFISLSLFISLSFHRFFGYLRVRSFHFPPRFFFVNHKTWTQICKERQRNEPISNQNVTKRWGRGTERKIQQTNQGQNPKVKITTTTKTKPKNQPIQKTADTTNTRVQSSLE